MLNAALFFFYFDLKKFCFSIFRLQSKGLFISDYVRFLSHPLTHVGNIGNGVLESLMCCLNQVHFSLQTTLHITVSSFGCFQLFLNLLSVQVVQQFRNLASL